MGNLGGSLLSPMNSAVSVRWKLRLNHRSQLVLGGEQPRLFGVEAPKPRLEAVRIVDMTASNAWAEFAAIFTRTQAAHLEHEQAKAELKGLMPEDAKEAIGHGVRAKRSKSGAVSFDVLAGSAECSHAAV
jgi:hypothetical protein